MGEAKRRGTEAKRVQAAIQRRDQEDSAPRIIPKLEVATLQLDMAIRLFLERDYVSSLTLAGAAEEILGKLSKRAKLDNAVDFVLNFYKGQTEKVTEQEE
ncbi:hypothetical protein PQQ51_33975, partial [Paraburkholderia xenovorans]|uniref:hypothetical protein n=1 Tax=Paraburkholderia xenovorans TaxID=36873 RepID=UPI0038BC0B56